MANLRNVFCVVLWAGLFATALAQPQPQWLGRGFVFDNDNLLFPASHPFINNLGSEVFEKSGISVYLIALKSLDKQTIESLEDSIAQYLRPPYL